MVSRLNGILGSFALLFFGSLGLINNADLFI